MNFEQFKTPPRDLELMPDEIHVWSASLDQPDSCREMLYETLSQDERDRAKRFVFERDRRRFAACRGMLRSIIARYLDVKADSISFYYGLNGKPTLDISKGGEVLCFNLSHSEGLALYVFTRNSEVGVDVEYMRKLYEIERIAEHIFSQNEIEVFRSLPEEKKKEAFFTGWTRKEAIVKALGDGLSIPLDAFDISFYQGRQSKVTGTEGDSDETSSWFIYDLKPALGYAGAFAVKSNVFVTSCWQWEIN